ncbi:hypothetical protein HYG86_04555 [Alkalicella caledoniensis]|uniref:Uncharacterized protein n=1 Tax=Alkalicella caledoniensis TaxID=2731377 RepID=A0A7G9W5Y1_ALKCA|nr:hypothetical protein [Alkalicella caledoniensis]QNO14093.1 hypothetical protein HYG86_04555 [Alkalicella caledoniensis]
MIMVIVIFIGIVMFALGLTMIRKKSITENILDVIIDSLTGTFFFSEVGLMLFGLLLIVLGLVELFN